MRPAPTRLLLSPLTLACATTLAQPAAPPAGETIVITGATSAQRLWDAPYAASVIDAEALRAAGPMINLSEALARVPGLVANQRHNYAQDLQLGSRGFGARASFGVRGLRLYADGIPATMPDGQGQVAHIDLAGAERIEVLRGPFSALYGNASGGVIAVFSAPVRQAQLDASLDAGSQGLRQGRVQLAAPLAPGLDLRASLADLALDGFRPQSAAHRTLGQARLRWQQGADTVTLQAGDHQQDAQDPLGLSRAQFLADPTQTTPQATQYDTRKTARQTQAGLHWRHRFGGEGALRQATLMVYNGTRGVTQWLAIPPATQAAARHGGGLVDFDRDYRGGEARLLWQWRGAELAAGLALETQRDDRQGWENFSGSGSTQQLGVQGRLRRDEDNRASTREAFVQGRWPLAPALALTGGLRGGRASLRTRDRYLANGDDSGALDFRYTNPVLGLHWAVAPHWALHASAARGFESPTLGELAYRPDGQAGFNTALRGQTSRQLELGSKWRGPLGGRAAGVELVLFSADTDDEIGVQTNSGGRASYRNLGRTQRLGAELAAHWQPATGWRLQLAATALRARYREAFLTCTAAPCGTPNVRVAAGNRVAGTQGASAWAELAWQPVGGAWGEWALEWRAAGRTAVNDSNSEFAPGHALAHLRWRHTLALGPLDALEVLARVDNLADRAVVGSVIVNDGNGRYYEPAAPRSLLLSLRWRHRW